MTHQARRLVAAIAVALALLSGLAARGTAPAEPFFFVQFSDPQFGMFAANEGFEQETANLQFAVAAVNRLRPAFVIVTGDLVHRVGDPKQIAEYKRLMGMVGPKIPVYHVAGNHDVGNEPTPETLAAYRREFGPDYYSFRHGDFAGIVLNSVLYHTPAKAPDALKDQDGWFRAELDRIRRSAPRHIVVFLHHPLFEKDPAEPDGNNIALARRAPLLSLLRDAGVRHVFAGHYHRNAGGRDGDLEMVASGPVGRPLGDTASGLRVVTVTDAGLEHRYYHFGELPAKIALPAMK